MLVVGPWTLPAFLIISLGYTVASSLLQYSYYYRKAATTQHWKTQPSKVGGVGDANWWLPMLQTHKVTKKRHRLHGIFATVNLLIASMCAAVTAELTTRGLWTRLRSDPPQSIMTGGHGGQLVYLLTSFCWSSEPLLLVAALVVQSVLEYGWHLAMHSRWCYVRLHKYHHYYESPEPFDDMFIHPLEAAGYYCILYSPAYLLPMRVSTFCIYMALLGTFGILDHSGIKMSIPGLYATEDHDMHHSAFEVNYSFPFPYLDILFGTYKGTFLGRRYDVVKAERRKRMIGGGGVHHKE